MSTLNRLNTCLLLSFIFQFEGCLNATPLVQKSSSHVNFAHITHVKPNEIEAHIEHNIRQQLVNEIHRVIMTLEHNPFQNYTILKKSAKREVERVQFWRGKR